LIKTLYSILPLHLIATQPRHNHHTTTTTIPQQPPLPSRHNRDTTATQPPLPSRHNRDTTTTTINKHHYHQQPQPQPQPCLGELLMSFAPTATTTTTTTTVSRRAFDELRSDRNHHNRVSASSLMSFVSTTTTTRNDSDDFIAFLYSFSSFLICFEFCTTLMAVFPLGFPFMRRPTESVANAEFDLKCISILCRGHTLHRLHSPWPDQTLNREFNSITTAPKSGRHSLGGLIR